MNRAAIGLAIVLGFAGCATMEDVKPGGGRTLEVRGHSYEEIWQAALKVADEHFEIREQDQAQGVIRAERTYTMWGYGAWVGIYIVPPTAGADRYTVEIVSRKKLATNITEQGWEKKVLRDLDDVLGGRPMR